MKIIDPFPSDSTPNSVWEVARDYIDVGATVVPRPIRVCNTAGVAIESPFGDDGDE